MAARTVPTGLTSARLAASLFGVLAGLGGLWHGIGEVLQGDIAPSGIVIQSWTQGPIATNMGGEPGMTIIPNLLITGVLCIVASFAIVLWAAALVQRKRGGSVLIILSVLMLLVGGGFAPPFIGILAGIAGTRINSSSAWWRSHISARVRRFLSRLWPWVFGIGALTGVFLLLGSLILVYFFDMNNPGFFVMNFFVTILFLLFTILTGIARDIGNNEFSAGMPK